MAVQGLRDVSGFTIGGDRAQRPENWREGILLLFPNGDTPLTALTSVMRTEVTDDPKFHWFEKIMSDQRLELTATLAMGATTATVLTPQAREVKAGHLLYVEETGEIIHVQGDAASDVLTGLLSRSFGVVADTAVTVGADNPHLLIIGTVHEEGSAAPTGVAYDPTDKFNFTQIFRNTLEATRTAVNTRLRTGDAIREAKREALQYHAIEMERAFFFGDRVDVTFNQRPLRATEGFFGFMAREEALNPGRLFTATAATTIDQLEDDIMKNIFDYGSSEKLAFCGNRALLTIQQIIRKNSDSPYQIVQGQKEFGMNVTRLVSPFGELVLKAHPLFNRITSDLGGSPAFDSVDSWMAVVDMEEVRYRPLRNSDTQYTTNLQTPGEDQTKAGYLTEAGLEFHHFKSHFVVKTLTGAA